MSSAPQRNEFESGSTNASNSGSYLVRPRPVSRWITLAGAAVAALVTLCFFMLFWNRFLGLRSGDGGFTGGVFFLRGILPYRDFYYPVPPLFLFRSAAALAIFGKLPIVTRACGVFERVMLAMLLYAWLVRLFRVQDATLAALVTMVVSAGDFADPVSSYNHFTIMLAVAAGLTASYALDAAREKRVLAILGAFAGVLAFSCFASKQTIGLGVTVVIPVVTGLCLSRLEGLAKAARFLAGFTAGWLLTLSILIRWMLHARVLNAFLTQSFVEGPAAKSSHPANFLLHTLATLQNYWWAALTAAIILVIAWLPWRRSEVKARQDTSTHALQGVILAAMLGLGAIAVSAVVRVPWASPALQFFDPELPAKPTIYVSLLGSGLLLIAYACRFLTAGLSRRQWHFALFAAIAFTVAFMTSLSFPAFEAMCVPGLALVLAVLLNDFEGWRRWSVYAACGVLLFCQAQAKERMPFGFAGWLEPSVIDATMASSLPELRGFRLPPETVDFVDSTVRIVREHSTANDTIFVYPELGFFYGITDRRPATFSGSHNIDVVPDAFTQQEAQRLLQARPAVLIYGRMPEAFLREEEDHWRNGQRSGQRDLIAAVETLAREYKLERSSTVFGHPVEVFVRKSPGATGW